MQKIKSPIVIVNYKNPFKSLDDLKKSLKDIEKNLNLVKRSLKQKNISFEFLFSVPSMFIFPLNAFLKEKRNKLLQKILIGTNKKVEVKNKKSDNQYFFSQINSLGGKFVVLEDLDNLSFSKFLEEENNNISNKNILNSNNKNSTNSILFDRFNNVSRKVEDKSKNNVIEKDKKDEAKELLEKKIQILEDNIKSSLESGVITIFKIKENKFSEDFKNITKIVKGVLKNLHYNLFDRLIICYEPEKEFLETDLSEIEDCEEKAIAIRRTIANMFGIDNAKKVRIIYGGRINESNTREIIQNGGVDGIFLNDENFSADTFSKIFIKLKTK